MKNVFSFQSLRNKITLEFMYALIVILIVFSPFIGQYLFSDVVTFAKSGDQDTFCYAAFMHIRECFLFGRTFVGIDGGTFNGATEFFLRGNCPTAYFPFYAFAFVSQFFPPRGIYLLMYAVHMFFGVLYFMKLCNKYFSLNRKIAMIVAMLFVYQLCVQGWYISFYFATSLSVITTYYFLEYYHAKSVSSFSMAAFCTLLSITSGYITVSIAGLIISYLVFLLMTVNRAKFSVKKLCTDSFPVLLAGACCLPYCWQLSRYVKRVVGASTTLADSVYYKADFGDLFSILSAFSFSSSSKTEGIAAFSLGISACIFIVIAIKDHVIERLHEEEKRVVYFTGTVFLLLFLWSMESETGFSAWMFSWVPIFGQMHIPHRYLMIVVPFFYVAIGILINNIRWNCQGPVIKKISHILIAILTGYLIVSKCGIEIPFINPNQFIFESICTLFCLNFVCECPHILRPRVAIVWIFCMLVMGATMLYNQHTLYMRSGEIKNVSIIYNKPIIQAIDNFIRATGVQKELYRFVAYDSSESVPRYLLSNYPWYGYSQYRLCNYTGYEPHLSTPKEYRNWHYWFDQYDWEYVMNTRADYLMTDQATIDKKPELFQKIVDITKGKADLGNGRVMYALKKTIPSVLNGKTYEYDTRNTLDNGFFYSPELTKDDIVAFSTDESSFYELSLQVPQEARLLFLPYPNRYYAYFIDGHKIRPEIIHFQSILHLEPGKHIIRIEYRNVVGNVGFIIAVGFPALLLTFFIISLVIKCFHLRKGVCNE